MSKYLTSALFVCVILSVSFFALNAYIYNEKQADDVLPITHYTDASYVISGTLVPLRNGVAEVALTPESATKTIVRYFGNEVTQDLDDDGRDDIAFLLTQETGGSSTLFYLVGALSTDAGYVGTQALLLGDRIAPQSTTVGPGRSVIVTYADRAPGEGFDIAPSIGKNITALLDTTTMQFGEVVRDFEGEADVERMTLTQKSWTWKVTEIKDGIMLIPKQAGAFEITFEPDGHFSAKTDCNSVGGTYIATPEKNISFGDMVSTKMFCEDSEERLFITMLKSLTTYRFTTKGELMFDTSEGGTALFK